MARTKQQQLDDLDALIAKIEGSPNQTTVIHGQTYAKHQLKDLYDRREQLEAAATAEARGGVLRTQRAVPL
jgi:hypothetical protein